MGIRLLVLVFTFISAYAFNSYAEADSHKEITFDTVIENINHKVRRTKSCEDMTQYLDLLDSLKNEKILSEKQEKRVEVILQNRC
jgi:hypothetical protein